MAERREVVAEGKIKRPDAEISKLCQFSGYSRTQFYYSKKQLVIRSRGRPPPGFTVNRDGRTIFDHEVVNLLKGYRSDIHFMTAGGARILTRYLAVEHGVYVNHKKIYRLCSENDLLLYSSVKVQKKVKKTRCAYHEITGPNQLWQFDLKHIFIHQENKWCYLLTFIDVFTKKVVGYTVGRSMKAGQLVATLAESLFKEGISDTHGLRIRSDNGPQMSSNRFYFYLKKLEQKLSHEFIPPRTPNRNAYIEAFFSIFEDTVIKARYFRSYTETYGAVVDFVQFYNHRRLHGSIGHMSPMQFIEKFKKGEFKDYRISA
jgi:putative transposase